MDFDKICVTYISSISLIKIIIDLKNNEIFLNGNLKRVDIQKIEQLVNLILRIPKNYKQDSTFDYDSCLIELINKNGTEKIRTNSKSFEDFSLLQDWVEDIYE